MISWTTTTPSAGGSHPDRRSGQRRRHGEGGLRASLYILTGLPGVYDRAQQHIHPGYIDFEPMFHMGLLLLARPSLWRWPGTFTTVDSSGGYTPQDIVSYCDTDGVALAARALLLRSGGATSTPFTTIRTAREG